MSHVEGYNKIMKIFLHPHYSHRKRHLFSIRLPLTCKMCIQSVQERKKKRKRKPQWHKLHVNYKWSRFGKIAYKPKPIQYGTTSSFYFGIGSSNYEPILQLVNHSQS